MIKAKELRIGNYVNYLGTPSKILSGAQIDKHFKDFEPIPIMPKILEKFGFFETSTDGEFIYNERGIIKININNIGLITFNVGEIIFSTVHYLHQIQNLYLDLTGEELEIKTPHKNAGPI